MIRPSPVPCLRGVSPLAGGEFSSPCNQTNLNTFSVPHSTQATLNSVHTHSNSVLMNLPLSTSVQASQGNPNKFFRTASQLNRTSKNNHLSLQLSSSISNENVHKVILPNNTLQQSLIHSEPQCISQKQFQQGLQLQSSIKKDQSSSIQSLTKPPAKLLQISDSNQLLSKAPPLKDSSNRLNTLSGMISPPRPLMTSESKPAQVSPLHSSPTAPSQPTTKLQLPTPLSSLSKSRSNSHYSGQQQLSLLTQQSFIPSHLRLRSSSSSLFPETPVSVSHQQQQQHQIQFQQINNEHVDFQPLPDVPVGESNFSNQVEKLESKIELPQGNNSNNNLLQQQLSQKQIQIDSLHSQLQAKSEELNSHSITIQSQKRAYLDLQSENHTLVNKIQQLGSQNQTLSAHVAMLQSQNACLENNSSVTQLAKSRERCSQLEQLLENANKENERMLSDTRAKIELLANENSKLNEALQSQLLRQSISSQNASFSEETIQQVSALINENTRLSELFQTIQQRLQQTLSIVEKKDQELLKLTNQVSEKQQGLDSLRIVLAEKVNSLEKLQSEKQEISEKFSIELKEQQNLRIAYEQEIKQLRVSLANEKEELGKEKETLQEQFESLEIKNTQLAKELVEIEQRVENLIQENQKLTQTQEIQDAEIQRQAQDFHDQLESTVNKKLDEQRAHLSNSYNSEITKLHEEIIRRNEILNQEKERSNLQADNIQESQERINELEDRIQQLEERNNEIEEINSQLESQNHELTEKLQELEEEINNYQEERWQQQSKQQQIHQEQSQGLQRQSQQNLKELQERSCEQSDDDDDDDDQGNHEDQEREGIRQISQNMQLEEDQVDQQDDTNHNEEDIYQQSMTMNNDKDNNNLGSVILEDKTELDYNHIENYQQLNDYHHQLEVENCQLKTRIEEILREREEMASEGQQLSESLQQIREENNELVQLIAQTKEELDGSIQLYQQLILENSHIKRERDELVALKKRQAIELSKKNKELVEKDEIIDHMQLKLEQSFANQQHGEYISNSSNNNTNDYFNSSNGSNMVNSNHNNLTQYFNSSKIPNFGVNQQSRGQSQQQQQQSHSGQRKYLLSMSQSQQQHMHFSKTQEKLSNSAHISTSLGKRLQN